MHAPTPLSGWHPLNAMTAYFVVEIFDSCALEHEGDGLMSGARVRSAIRASFSTLSGCKAQIGVGEFGDKEFCVITPLAGSDFKRYLRHGSVSFLNRFTIYQN